MDKKKNPYSLKLIWQLIRHGLILQGIRHGFAKIGIDIMPYYWVQEETTISKEPAIRADPKDFEFKILDPEDIHIIRDMSDSINENKIIQSLEQEQECVGLKFENQIAAYMFIELNTFTFKNRAFPLKENESYLLNMFTFDSFRGKSLAPYLRYCCYRYLEKKGVTLKYSISNYFNKSAIKFKQKLNSHPLKLLVHIELFKKFRWHFVLKSFS